MNIISVDLGTSSVRAAIVNDSLEILYQESLTVSLVTDSEGKAEQDADEILSSAVICIQKVLSWSQENQHSIDGLSFSNAVASLVCLDADFTPSCTVFTYADLRSFKESKYLINSYGKDFFIHTATPMHASYWLPKLLWLKNSGYDFSNFLYFCTLKDLLVYKITGQFITDYSNAVATGLCNIKNGRWDGKLLEIAGIKIGQLPEILPTTAVIKIKNSHSESITLPEGISVTLGAIDGVLSSLGAGAYKPGQVTTMLGSSGACRVASKSPLTNPESYGIWSYPLEEEIWICGGAMNSGGLVTKWLVDNFSNSQTADEKSFDTLFEQAQDVSIGADNLLFLPFLFGERAPIYNENARGVYFGLHSKHTIHHMARAGLEGILFVLYSIFKQLQINQTKEIEIRATGGYIRSELMLQIQADMFGLPILVPANYEGSIIGAAALALKSLSHINDYDHFFTHKTIETEYLPNPINHKQYQKEFLRFQKLYSALDPLFYTLF